MMVPRQPLRVLLASAPLEAVDLIEKLLVLNPHKRLTAQQALEHPYVRAFHKPEREPALDHDVVPTLSDAIQLTVEEYRNKLYEVIAQQGHKVPRQHLHLSPSKFQVSPHRSPTEPSSNGKLPKTKSSGDLITAASQNHQQSRTNGGGQQQQVQKKVSSISAPGDIVPSSRSPVTSSDRKQQLLVARHSDDHVLRRETSKSLKVVHKSTSSSNLPRSYSGHALVKLSTTDSPVDHPSITKSKPKNCWPSSSRLFIYVLILFTARFLITLQELVQQ